MYSGLTIFNTYSSPWLQRQSKHPTQCPRGHSTAPGTLYWRPSSPSPYSHLSTSSSQLYYSNSEHYFLSTTLKSRFFHPCTWSCWGGSDNKPVPGHNYVALDIGWKVNPISLLFRLRRWLCMLNTFADWLCPDYIYSDLSPMATLPSPRLATVPRPPHHNPS